VGGLGGAGAPFLLVALLALSVAAVLRRAPARLRPPLERAPGGDGLPLRFMGLFFLYVGLEASAGHWGAYHLDAVGEPGAFWIGLYWGFQTLGRFLLAPYTRRLSEAASFRAALLVAALVFLALGRLPGPGLGYALAGFALAPAFPAAMAWAQGAHGPGGRVTAWLLIAAALGGAVFPPLFGLLVAHLGPRAVPYGLFALALSVFLYARFASPRRSPP